MMKNCLGQGFADPTVSFSRFTSFTMPTKLCRNTATLGYSSPSNTKRISVSRTNSEFSDVRRTGEIDARANISSISDSTSLITTDFLCPQISFLHDRSGITFDSPLSRLSRPQFPPTNFLNEQFISRIKLDRDKLRFKVSRKWNAARL